MRDMGVTVDFVSMTDPDSFGAAVTEKTKIVWLEVCSNPSLQIVDLEATCKR